MEPKRRAITVQLGSFRDEAPAAGTHPVRPDSGIRPSSDLTANAPRVLVVDDDADSRARLVSMLERIYRVEEADGAQMAIALCASARPDVILFNADRSDVSSRRLQTLLDLALGDEKPPLVVLADSAANAEAGSELIPREDELPDAITLVSLLERAMAGSEDDG